MAEAQKPFDFSQRLFKLVSVLITVLVILWGLKAYEVWRNINGDYPQQISFEAQGKAFVVPDVAVLNVGVTTDGQDSAALVDENTKKMAAVMEALKALGIEEKDIKTTAYNLSPKYNWTEEGGSVQDGYTLSQSLEVRIRDFDKIGGAISATTQAGANLVGGVNFTIDDFEAAKSEARVEAIADAKSKADAVAEATGLSIGKLLNYYEYSDSPYYYEKAGMGGGEMVSLDAATVTPGEQEITLTVNLTYRLR